MLKKIIKTLLPLGWLALLLYSVVTFFARRGGVDFAIGADFKTWAALMFPLFGLIAFNMLWLQFILGSSMELWRKLYPMATKFHRKNGIVVFLVTFTHPLLIILGFGFSDYISRAFVSESLRIYALFGSIAFYLMIVTVTTALLWRSRFLKNKWRVLHILNYLVFLFAFVHSWNIGSDIQTSPLRYIWIFYGTTAFASAIGKLYRAKVRPRVRARREQAASEASSSSKQ